MRDEFIFPKVNEKKSNLSLVTLWAYNKEQRHMLTKSWMIGLILLWKDILCRKAVVGLPRTFYKALGVCGDDDEYLTVNLHF
jgi:hypothetical protein